MPQPPAPPIASLLPSAPDELIVRLLAWYARARRDLPWRRDVTPYRVLVSELMLQQTQVETVRPYFERWMAQLPTLEDLARAPLDDVLQLWTGLGYYARARNLHRLAQAVVEQGRSELPRTAESLRALPGVGPYTAGAVASIAWGEPEPLVDGNVARVLGRILGLQGDLRAPPRWSQLWQAAELLVRRDGAREQPGAWNQALMELGALVCRPEAPTCLLCPVAPHCAALAQGLVDAIPPPRARTRQSLVESGHLVILRGDHVLAAQRPQQGAEGRLWGGLWELPGGPCAEGESPREAAERHVAERLGLAIPAGVEAARTTHLLSHRRYVAVAFRADAPDLPPCPEPVAFYTRLRWVATSEILGDRGGASRLTSKLLVAALEARWPGASDRV
jgi:A/G-specific adenine glycosylase